MWWLASVALVGWAVLFGFVAYGFLQNLWSDYQDSEPLFYLLGGIPPLLLALGAVWWLIWLWRSPK